MTQEETVRSRKNLDMPMPQSVKRSKRPDSDDPLVQRTLDPLAEALAQPDERSREAAVERVAQLHVPAGTGLLSRALVELLGREEGPVRDQAVAYLSRLGPLAVPDLVLRFPRTDRAALQQGIIDALTCIAPGLDRDQSLELVIDLWVLLGFAVEQPVRLGLGKVLVAVRRANEASSRGS